MELAPGWLARGSGAVEGFSAPCSIPGRMLRKTLRKTLPKNTPENRRGPSTSFEYL
jgi:hypothetical protein